MTAQLSASSEELAQAVRDLAAICAWPTAWGDADAKQIADSVAALLAALPGIEFAHVLVRCQSGPNIASARSARRLDCDETARIGRAMACWLPEPPADVVAVKNPIADGTLRILPAAIGATAHGLIALGSSRADFPTEIERLLVRAAATQAAAGIERRRSLQAHHRLGATLEQRISQEISERLRVEEGSRQARKMEAVGRLTGGVAHDFNNLLTAIWASLELLERHVTTALGRRLLETATRAAYRGAELTGKLLAFSRQQHLLPQAVDLNRVVSNGRDMIQRSVGWNVKVEMALAPDLHRAMIDPVWFELALLHLVLDAREAMPGGGRLTITTRNAAIPEEGSPIDLSPGEYVAISLADNGLGIEPQLLDHIIEPSFTTTGAGKGGRLGRSMVHRIVERSGGSLAIGAGRAAGTFVEMFLPRA